MDNKTPQEIFDFAYKGIIKQGVPSISGPRLCKYAGPNGTACAIGLMVDRETAETWDEIQGTINYLCESQSALTPPWVKKNLPLLSAIQECHDDASQQDDSIFISTYKELMVNVAPVFNLTVPEEK